MERAPNPSVRGAHPAPPDESGRGRRGCALCEAAGSGPLFPGPPPAQAAGSPDGTVVAYADDHLVALVEQGTPGVLVAPRGHVDGLTTAPAEGAVVLAALRRAAATVESSYAAEGTAIEPTTDLPGALGHVCYRIHPTRGNRPLPPGDHPGVDPDVLALALRRTSVGGGPAPG